MAIASVTTSAHGDKEVKVPVVSVAGSSQTLLEELDARQEEVLAQLEALNLRIEQVLRECAPAVQSEAA